MMRRGGRCSHKETRNQIRVYVYGRHLDFSERLSKLPSQFRAHPEAAVSVQTWETEICHKNLSTLHIAAPTAAKIFIFLF